jgi:hypothetical protein
MFIGYILMLRRTLTRQQNKKRIIEHAKDQITCKEKYTDDTYATTHTRNTHHTRGTYVSNTADSRWSEVDEKRISPDNQ